MRALARAALAVKDTTLYSDNIKDAAAIDEMLDFEEDLMTVSMTKFCLNTTHVP